MITPPFWHDARSAIYLGDACDVLAAMPAGSADCIVTSPPYWARRDFGVAGQYGREPGPAAYVETLRAVLDEARRVLAEDGTCWLNLGDSYTDSGAAVTGLHSYLGSGLTGRHTPGMAAKNLLGLPWRVALALQGDGWIIRNAIVWHKPNAMPESVRDRMNCRYELLFLLVKSRHYWFDLDPIRIPHVAAPATPGGMPRHGGTGTQRQSGMPMPGRHPGDGKHSGNRPGSRPSAIRSGGARSPKYGPHAREVTGARRHKPQPRRRLHPNGRNPGDVWSIPARPYRGPHFAAFPAELPTRCIQAGCKPDGTVLDMFAGTGTTGLAALTLGRRFTGIELNPAFAALAAERLRHAAARQPDSSDGGRQ
jgi:site-specific DNA-methyltransferase (cytosine-N4-specific)